MCLLVIFVFLSPFFFSIFNLQPANWALRDETSMTTDENAEKQELPYRRASYPIDVALH